jgi:hypothetical protein
VRFSEFLRTTVLTSAAAATALAAVTVGAAAETGDSLVPSLAWWAIAAILGLRLGHRAQPSHAIGSLLANSRTQSSLPEISPARTVINRLWPLLVCTIGAGALAFAYPQVSGIAAGFAIIWALAWRRQASAVTAIEERDGARFYVDRTSPLKPIRLVRTPGFRSNLLELNGAAPHRPRARPRA